MGGNFPPLYITSSFTVLFTLLRQLFFWWNCSHQSISDIWTSDFKSAKDDGINESPLNQSLEHVMRNIYCTISHVSSLESLDKPSSIEMWSESGFLSKEHENEQLSKEVDLDDNQLKTEKHNSNVTSADTVAKKMKSKFTKSWITYLRVPLPLDVYKELLDSCLKSAFLPAYLAASFVKKLIRLLLSVSPSGSLVIIALIHNLLRRHPSINCLVHQGVLFGRQIPFFTTTVLLFQDLLSLGNDLTVMAKTSEMKVEDFSSGSYDTVFGDEGGRG